MRHFAIATAKGIALGILVAGLTWGGLYLSASTFFGSSSSLGFWMPSLMFLTGVVAGATFAARRAPSNKFVAGSVVGSVLAAVGVVGLWLMPGIREGSIWSIVFPAIALGGIFGAIATAALRARNVAL